MAGEYSFRFSEEQGRKDNSYRKKRKLDIEADSDSTSISSFTVTDGNTSSDLSMHDFLSEIEEEEDQIEAVIEQDENMAAETEVTSFKKLMAIQHSDATNNEKSKKEEKSRVVGKGSQMPSIDDAGIDKYVAVFYTDPKPYYC